MANKIYKITFRVDPDLYQKILDTCNDEKISLTKFLTDSVEDRISNEEIKLNNMKDEDDNNEKR